MSSRRKMDPHPGCRGDTELLGCSGFSRESYGCLGGALCVHSPVIYARGRESKLSYNSTKHFFFSLLVK